MPVAIVAAVALLLQVAVAPGVFAAPQNTLLAICHAATGDTGDRAPQPLSGHDHENCLLCQMGAVAFLVPPAAPLVPVPAAAAITAVRVADAGVRGGARLAYASRAPPAIG